MTEFRRSRQRRSWSEPVVEVAGGAGCGSRPLARESTGYPSPLLPPRRFRGGREVPIHVPRGARDEHHNAVLADGVVMETDGRGRLAWAEGGRAAWGSRPSVTLAACSVALLAFLSNRVSAFHVCCILSTLCFVSVKSALVLSKHVTDEVRGGHDN